MYASLFVSLFAICLAELLHADFCKISLIFASSFICLALKKRGFNQSRPLSLLERLRIFFNFSLNKKVIIYLI